MRIYQRLSRVILQLSMTRVLFLSAGRARTRAEDTNRHRAEPRVNRLEEEHDHHCYYCRRLRRRSPLPPPLPLGMAAAVAVEVCPNMSRTPSLPSCLRPIHSV